MVDELLGELHARQEGTAPLPVSTGSVDLDRQLHGGFRPGQLVVLGARPSMGKTALVLGMAVAAARRDVPTLYCSLEMSRAEVAARFLAMEGVSTDIQAAGLSEPTGDAAEQAREKLRSWPLRVDDDAAATVLAQIESATDGFAKKASALWSSTTSSCSPTARPRTARPRSPRSAGS